MTDLKHGDVVRHKDYTTWMTVERVMPIKRTDGTPTGDAVVKVMWFDRLDQLHRESFQASSLVRRE